MWRDVGAEMGVRRKVRFSDPLIQGPSIHTKMIKITSDTSTLEVPHAIVYIGEIERPKGRPSGFDKSEIQRMRAARVAEEEMELYQKDAGL